MRYSIELSYNNKEESFVLPVNPQQLEAGDAAGGTTYDVIGLGEINVLKPPTLTDFTLAGLFPATLYPFRTVETPLPPMDYVLLLRKWMRKQRPVRFILIGAGYEINTAASIEQFDWTEAAGGSGDIEYTLKLKSYRFYAARKVNRTRTASGDAALTRQAEPRPDEREIPATYTLRRGDTLWTVAQWQLGDGTRWREIQTLNGISEAEVLQLPVGKVLQLPQGGDANG
ncbi:LysM peptidoglycan-binding domain-containing protein [Paenibacillus sp. IB182496]|uniref:LysM peptidoglycan-binding domain-containing protein n=1 Tax=Paenibacillus sabuli TaxID=2772509 RepID=A0A927BVM6_9BACL|nr:LysM peptidoglycan-binding domain-containing protein [Paenibacillus sabuli]MBD2846188.1 LysM peptidoglycan-binding domain-containing protein [Paenibacillus sabuli]